jgi:hypothetical protein
LRGLHFKVRANLGAPDKSLRTIDFLNGGGERLIHASEFCAQERPASPKNQAVAYVMLPTKKPASQTEAGLYESLMIPVG